MLKKNIAYYIPNEFNAIVACVSKSALTRAKKRISLKAGAVNRITARRIDDVVDFKDCNKLSSKELG